MTTAQGDLPTGTVTLLFTDIEGSTRLASKLGLTFSAQLGAHDRILREAISANHGTVSSTAGDSFFATFPDAVSSAAAAATELPASGQVARSELPAVDEPVPWFAEIASRRIRSCAPSCALNVRPSLLASLVLPSMSVNSKVTVPVGRSPWAVVIRCDPPST